MTAPLGYHLWDHDPQITAWARAAAPFSDAATQDPQERAKWLRHGETWFVGVDSLPNDHTGAIGGVPLPDRARALWPHGWHAAQVSVVYPGYPRQDPDEADTAHRYRLTRHAAHVDGLVAQGPQKRRFLLEPHAFILGIALDDCAASPLTIWPGSHVIMGAALRDAIGARDPQSVDITDAYTTARRRVFETIAPVSLPLSIGRAVVLHRHLLHGVAPWDEALAGQNTRRTVAYFRPQYPSAPKGAIHPWLDID